MYGGMIIIGDRDDESVPALIRRCEACAISYAILVSLIKFKFRAWSLPPTYFYPLSHHRTSISLALFTFPVSPHLLLTLPPPPFSHSFLTSFLLTRSLSFFFSQSVSVDLSVGLSVCRSVGLSVCRFDGPTIGHVIQICLLLALMIFQHR